MTIETIYHKTNAEAGKVFCSTCCGGKGTHFVAFHNGYGDEAEPLDGEQKEMMEDAAETHEENTFGTHNIKVFYFGRGYENAGT